jgi:hypothetical protein
MEESAVPVCRPGQEHDAGSPGDGHEMKTGVGARFRVLVTRERDSKQVVAGR